MSERSKLLSITIRNLGCVGPEGLTVELNNIVCLVGRNNAGKSTILRAYELAQSSKSISDHDRCQWTPDGGCPEVELSVHIPEGVENVDERWKVRNGPFHVVRSRWQWKVVGKPERQTWNPALKEGAGDWDGEQKAGGADNVFNSRLPVALRIDALKDSAAEHDVLMKIILDPIAKQLEILKSEQNSSLTKALFAVAHSTKEPIEAYQEEINRVGQKVGSGVIGVFPNLNINIKIGIDPPAFDATKALLEGSSIRFVEGTSDTALRQQGAGSRRALFWALLQVRSEIVRQRDIQGEKIKSISKLKASFKTESKKVKPKQETLDSLSAQIEAAESDGDTDSTSFPGYVLLIDEPENCLHPMAVRAARNYLYNLAKDSNWQVLITTHSPYFIDPLEDHTTIVRLEREGHKTTPRTFRAGAALFSEEERQNLRALLQLDSSLSEVFFGSYPVIVEGDTEYAAYIAAILEKGHALATQITVVNARGKALICPLIKLLTHFAVPFGVLHDTDSPRRSDGGKNSAWAENGKIIGYVAAARLAGLAIRHRVSVPDFERSLALSESGKDKPILVYREVAKSDELQNNVVTTYTALISGSDLYPSEGIDQSSTHAKIEEGIVEKVKTWAASNCPNDRRFDFEGQTETQTSSVAATLHGA